MHAKRRVAYLISGTTVEFLIGEAVARDSKAAIEVANKISRDTLRNSGWQ
jgi:hypothetical protein